ncbi:hypothetical protein S83_018240, partial [Arachis hypogaea]
RRRLETQTFHLSHSEYTITLEDVAIIFELPTNGMPVSGFKDSNTIGLKNKFMIQFDTIPTAADHKGSGVKLAWLCTLKRHVLIARMWMTHWCCFVYRLGNGYHSSTGAVAAKLSACVLCETRTIMI